MSWYDFSMTELAEMAASDRRVSSRPAPEPLSDHIPELDLAHVRKLAEFRYQVRRFLHVSHVAAEEAGMRFQQYQMLQCVCGMPDGVEPTIANVAARMFLKHNSTVELVDRTIAQGLLRRTGDPNDHRRILLRVTPEGNAFWRRWVSFIRGSLRCPDRSWCRRLTACSKGAGRVARGVVLGRRVATACMRKTERRKAGIDGE